jgi:REP element-mobilizing transposase RayT
MGHTYTNCVFHIVFGTKHRSPWLVDEVRPRLCQFVGGILRGTGGQPIITNGVEDHLHVLTKLPPHHDVAEAARDIKANSSRWLRRTFANQHAFAWQRGYSAFSVSESQIERVRRYIANQEAHHRRQTFEAELLELLRRNGIACDVNRLWE